MHILHINDQLILGGIPAAKLSVAKQLKEWGIKSTLYFRGVIDNRALEPFQREFPVFVGPRPLLRSVIASDDYDLIHATIWTMSYSMPAIASCGFAGPVVLSSHQGTLTDPIHVRVDHLLSVSEAGKNCVVDPLGRHCEVILNGVDTRHFAPEYPPVWNATGRRPTGERPILLWIGRINDWRKNFPGLSALAIALRNEAFDFWVMHSDDYPAAEDLRSSLGSERFVMTQGVPFERMRDVYGIVRESGGCLLVNSYTESCPNAVLEAMSSGCPVVAARVGGIPELIEHQETGMLFDVDDDLETVAAVIKQACSEPLRASLASKARCAAVKEFDFAKMGEKYRDFYARVIATDAYRHPLSFRQRAVRRYLRMARIAPVLIPPSRWV